MGRQITVELVSLLKAGCTLRVQDYEDAQPWLKVVLPNGRWIGSDCIDCLNFDCREITSSANGWMEIWLQEKGVPYAHG